MGWTYESYLGTSYGISVGLVLITMFIVFLALICSHDLVELLVNSVIGIDLESAEDPDISEVEMYHVKVLKKTPRYRTILVILYVTTGLILSIMPVLIFEGCVLSNAYVLPSDTCPDDPMDCYIFPYASAPTYVGSFSCVPGSSTQFPTNYSDPHASCFGWIIRRQTTRKVLDQVGICAGLIGLFGILLTFVVHIARKKVAIAIGIIVVSVLILITAVVLIAYYRWALSLLTYAALVLCMMVLICGPTLALLMRKESPPKIVENKPMSARTIKSAVIQPLSASQNGTNIGSANKFPKKTQVFPAFQ